MKTILLGAALIFLTGFIFRDNLRDIVSEKESEQKENKKKKNKKEKNSRNENSDVNASDVNVVNKWDLPEELKEVSGIAYLSKNRFACVQDELGVIFLYNTATQKVDKKISFTGTGDFEGITVNGNTAYVVRADGLLFQIDMSTGSSKEYRTPLTVNHNIEGLAFDKNKNRLLLAGKNDDPDYPGYKCIYEFDLKNQRLRKDPVIKIPNSANESQGSSGKKKSIMPSALGIHPATAEIYITDGPGSQLLIIGEDGKIKKQFDLGKAFAQPEGITFAPDGDIFISNEGKKQAGNIMEVELK